MINFKEEEVIKLAEEIFIHMVSKENTCSTMMEMDAKQAIEAAMIFRTEQERIFQGDR